MDVKQLFALLKTAKIPVAYDHFNKKTAPPFCTYTINESYFGGDEKNLFASLSADVKIYTTTKDLAVESVFDGLFDFVEFEKDTTYISDERLYETSYNFEIIRKI